MDRKRPQSVIVGCLALATVTVALYSPLGKNSFINFDDQSYVVKNLHVRAGLTWRTFTWSLMSIEQSNWHPLTWLSHALDCELYGLNAGGHHFTNLLLHGFNVLLLFLLLLRATGSAGRSWMVAALFALHPLNVESVAWVAERKNVLSTLFFLLTIGAYGWYAQKPILPRYLAVAVLFVLGLASKPMVITLPFVLLLLDFWPLQRIKGWDPPSVPSRKARKNRTEPLSDSALRTGFPVFRSPFSRMVLEKLPLLALCTGSAAITIVAQRSSSIRTLETFPLGVRLENAAYAYAMYIWKAFWPTRLALYYPHPRTALAAWQLGVALLFLAAVSALAWKYRFARRYLVTGWLWYLGTLVPVIGLVQVGDQAMADRYAYIPMLGVFVMAVWGAADWADHLQISFSWRALVAATALSALSFLTWRQIGYWQTSYDVWSHTLAVTENNPLAESDLAGALHAMGRPEEALPHFQNAVSMQSGDPVRRVDLAEDLAECGRLRDAIAQYETAIRLTSDPEKQARSYQSLAILYGELGEYDNVRESYREALRIDPPLGGEMIRNLSQSFAANPSGAGYLNLGMLLETAGRLSEARAAYQRALKLDPTLAEAKESLDALGRSNK
jgi:protein O-mannosyl-transferase